MLTFKQFLKNNPNLNDLNQPTKLNRYRSYLESQRSNSFDGGIQSGTSYLRKTTVVENGTTYGQMYWSPLLETDTRLSRIASCFSTYEVISLVCEFNPLYPDSYPGHFFLSIDSDPNLAFNDVDLIDQMIASPDSVHGSPNKTMSVSFSPKQRKRSVNIDPENLSASIGAVIRWALMFSPDGPSIGDYGFLTLRWTIKFSDPSMSSIPVELGQTLRITTDETDALDGTLKEGTEYPLLMDTGLSAAQELPTGQTFLGTLVQTGADLLTTVAGTVLPPVVDVLFETAIQYLSSGVTEYFGTKTGRVSGMYVGDASDNDNSVVMKTGNWSLTNVKMIGAPGSRIELLS